MTTKERNAMMYKIIKDNTTINFKIGFFSLTWTQIDVLAIYADFFRIKSQNGKSPARTIYDRLSQYERNTEK